MTNDRLRTFFVVAILATLLPIANLAQAPAELPPISYATTESIVDGANQWGRAALRFRRKALEGTDSMPGTYVGRASSDLLLDYQFTMEGAIKAAAAALDRGATRDDLGYFVKVVDTILDSPHRVGGGVLSHLVGKLDHSEEVETKQLLADIEKIQARLLKTNVSTDQFMTPQMREVMSGLPAELKEPYKWMAENGMPLVPGASQDSKMRFDLIMDAAGKVYAGNSLGPAMAGAPDMPSRMARFREELSLARGEDGKLTSEEALQFLDRVVRSGRRTLKPPPPPP